MRVYLQFQAAARLLQSCYQQVRLREKVPGQAQQCLLRVQ